MRHRHILDRHWQDLLRQGLPRRRGLLDSFHQTTLEKALTAVRVMASGVRVKMAEAPSRNPRVSTCQEVQEVPSG